MFRDSFRAVSKKRSEFRVALGLSFPDKTELIMQHLAAEMPVSEPGGNPFLLVDFVEVVPQSLCSGRLDGILEI